ncbi:hypothetical protein [Lacticaseibacillus suihuaensis]
MLGLWWCRLWRSRLLWLLAAVAVLFGSAVVGVTYWRKTQEEQTLVTRLNRQVESLAQEVQQAPARPKKLRPAEVPHWQALAFKKQLVTDQHRAAQALESKDYRGFTTHYEAALITTLALEKVEPNSGLALTQTTLPALKSLRRKVSKVSDSGQTLIWSTWSLAPRALAQRCLAILMWTPVFVFIAIGAGALWRELFDTPAWRYQLLTTRRRWRLQVADLGVSVGLLLGFTVLAVGVAAIWGLMLGGDERVTWRYPLSNTLSLGHQLVTQLSYWLPLAVFVVSWSQLGTLAVRQLSARLAALLLVAVGLGFIPSSVNPFAQLQGIVMTPGVTAVRWSAVVLMIIAGLIVVAIARRLCLTDYSSMRD